MSFSEKIIAWYKENKRDLPWRATQEPYNIWLSEIILQQTRVAQGTPYYERFIAAFPTVAHLARADEEQVLKLWQGLGYYSRARNLHAAAKMVVHEHGGTFPGTYKGLLALKGVGDYTASAIASICYDEPQAVVDGNVYRVLSRYFGVEEPINSTLGSRYFRDLAQEVLSNTNVRDYNQGIMEFGAMQCTPKNPNCLFCPLQDGCVALKEGKVDQLPVKVNKTKVRTRYFNYVVPLFTDRKKGRSTALVQRQGKGIWQGLWQFPLLETTKEVGAAHVERELRGALAPGRRAVATLYNERPVVHKLSHQHLHTKFWIVPQKVFGEHAVPVSELEKYPVPVLIADFIKTFKF